jgi:hypothetical protein
MFRVFILLASVDSLRESMLMRTRTLMSERARTQPDEPHIYRETRRRRLPRHHCYGNPPEHVFPSLQPVTASSYLVALHQRVHFRRGDNKSSYDRLAWSKFFRVQWYRLDTSLEPDRAIYKHRRGIFRDNGILSTAAAVQF